MMAGKEVIIRTMDIGADKQAVQVSDLLRLFNEISVECGN